MSGNNTSNCNCPCDSNCKPGEKCSPSTSATQPQPDYSSLSDHPSEWNPYFPPSFGPEKQLYCRTQYNLAIDKNGLVYGTKEPYHREAILFFTSAAVGEVKIKGVASGKYLAMNQKGILYGEDDAESLKTIFLETFDRNTGYNNYLSRHYAHLGWYVGIKKSGKPKPGPKTAYGQKAVMFLARPSRSAMGN